MKGKVFVEGFNSGIEKNILNDMLSRGSLELSYITYIQKQGEMSKAI
jgi:hypothetical protein